MDDIYQKAFKSLAHDLSVWAPSCIAWLESLNASTQDMVQALQEGIDALARGELQGLSKLDQFRDKLDDLTYTKKWASFRDDFYAIKGTYLVLRREPFSHLLPGQLARLRWHDEIAEVKKVTTSEDGRVIIENHDAPTVSGGAYERAIRILVRVDALKP